MQSRTTAPACASGWGTPKVALLLTTHGGIEFSRDDNAAQPALVLRDARHEYRFVALRRAATAPRRPRCAAPPSPC
ncbi:hypothetical protein [Pelomonas aquatica]|jgi:hypothetical protein|uniref:Uncharacterized protein n=1 Tax=Pelomonas aquatica TaxID=431058 RepID=A0A9X4LGV5_9BURK|nr:hypothetical protein [Pelomonas aquatica]MCY4755746.1 hypothetical protein [Pelomonas aquatica]MDG0862731.1 hypothetical protein [Pelomonas aquatica]